MKKPSYYKNQDDAKLFSELRTRVNARVAEIPGNRDRLIVVKSVLLPLLYLSLIHI